MDCNVIKDLLPLYIDDCCSEESANIVKEHIKTCSECKTIYESMNTPSEIDPGVSAPVRLSRISDWKASVLQSVLLFVSFAVITVGVALESATPSEFLNGFWAVTLVIPATGFMLSLANWYFVRFYKNRKTFSNCSLFATLGIIICAYIWAVFHYELFSGISHPVLLNIALFSAFFFGISILLSVISCVLSKVLSNIYAKMLGKEYRGDRMKKEILISVLFALIVLLITFFGFLLLIVGNFVQNI